MAALDQNIADARAVRNVIAVNQAIRLKCDIAGLIVTQAHVVVEKPSVRAAIEEARARAARRCGVVIDNELPALPQPVVEDIFSED